jgi:hypothetical protein
MIPLVDGQCNGGAMLGLLDKDRKTIQRIYFLYGVIVQYGAIPAIPV